LVAVVAVPVSDAKRLNILPPVLKKLDVAGAGGGAAVDAAEEPKMLLMVEIGAGVGAAVCWPVDE
jgi:hypothetical protein